MHARTSLSSLLFLRQPSRVTVVPEVCPWTEQFLGRLMGRWTLVLLSWHGWPFVFIYSTDDSPQLTVKVEQVVWVQYFLLPVLHYDPGSLRPSFHNTSEVLMCMFELFNKLFKLIYDTVLLDYQANVFSYVNSSSEMCSQPKNGPAGLCFNRIVDLQQRKNGATCSQPYWKQI